MTLFYQGFALFAALLSMLLLGFGCIGFVKKKPYLFRARWILLAQIVGQLPLLVMVLILYQPMHDPNTFLNSPITLFLLLLFAGMGAAYYALWRRTEGLVLWGWMPKQSNS